MYNVKFYDSVHRKGVQFTNIRNFQFTRSRNKSGKANFSLDQSPQTRGVNAGWLVEIHRDGKKVYWGQVIKKQNKKGKIKIFCHDAIGMLNKRTLRQRPVISQEGSLEIIEKLNGLELIKGFKLKAGSFIKPTGTSRFWHWEDNQYGDYIKDIGEQVKNISGEPQPFFYWITPDLDVIFEEEGARGYLHDIKFASLTVDEDITQTYNAVRVEGLPILKIPYDGDFWTEYLDTTHWEVGGTSYSSKTETEYGTSVATSTNWNSTANITGAYDGINSNTTSSANNLDVNMVAFDGDLIGTPTNVQNVIISAKAYGTGLTLTGYLSRSNYSSGAYCAGHSLSTSMTGSLAEYSATCTHTQGSPANNTDLTATYKIKIIIGGLGGLLTSQTKNGSSATGWINSSYAIGDDSNSAYETNSAAASDLIMTMQNFSISDWGSFSSYQFFVDAKRGSSAMASWTGYVSKDGGSTYCTGHSFTPSSSTYTISSIACSHSQAPQTEAELEGNTIKIKIDINGENEIWSDDFFCYIDNLYHKVNYYTGGTTTGYADGVKASVTYDSTADNTATTFSFDNTDKVFQARSLKNESRRQAGSSFTEHAVVSTKNIASGEEDSNYFNLENVTGCHFRYKYADNGAGSITGVAQAEVIFTDISGETRTWTFDTVDDPTEGVWSDAIDLDMSSGGVDSSGNFDINKVQKHSLSVVFTVPSATDSQIALWLDNYYLEQTPYEHIATDSDSIRRYGRLEKSFYMRNFYKNSDCQEMAETLLDHWKDPKLTINCSITGFIDIEPNTLIRIVFDDQVYVKPLSSITYYMNANGHESAQLTLGDFKKDDLEKVLDKLSEIHKNNNLLINPYKLV